VITVDDALRETMLRARVVLVLYVTFEQSSVDFVRKKLIIVLCAFSKFN